jgi:hypothetical protein
VFRRSQFQVDSIGNIGASSFMAYVPSRLDELLDPLSRPPEGPVERVTENGRKLDVGDAVEDSL